MSSIELESASETESDQYSSGNEEYQIEVEASDCSCMTIAESKLLRIPDI